MEKQVEEMMKNAHEHKDVVIFHVTSMSSEYDMYTYLLAIKMDKLAKEKKLDMTVKMDSASKIDCKGKDADVILLTPELATMLKEVKEKYPDKVVKLIDQKDYGFMNAENVLNIALN